MKEREEAFSFTHDFYSFAEKEQEKNMDKFSF